MVGIGSGKTTYPPRNEVDKTKGEVGTNKLVIRARQAKRSQSTNPIHMLTMQQAGKQSTQANRDNKKASSDG